MAINRRQEIPHAHAPVDGLFAPAIRRTDGTMETLVLVQAGARNERDPSPTGRAGDFSGISVDTDDTFLDRQ